MGVLDLFSTPLLAKVGAFCLAMGLIAGSYGGWKIHSWKDAAAEKIVINGTMKADAKSQAEATKKDAVVEKKAAATALKTVLALKEIDNAVPETNTFVGLKPAAQPGSPAADPAADAGPSCRLTAYAVGLLNRQLNPATADPAGWSDAEKQTLTDVGLREVSELIVLIGGQYQDLADRHDALVDFVLAEQAKQQKSRSLPF